MENVIKLEIRKSIILDAIERSKKKIFLDNLRKRDLIVQFDSKIRGFIGEIIMKEWFHNRGVIFESTNYLEENNNMDIDFLLKKENKLLNIELKTSLIPDYWESISNCLKKGDIKIIKRTEKIEQLSGDFHLQMYYNKLRKKRDNFLKNLNIKNLMDYTAEEIYNLMKLKEYEVFFVSWIDKDSLIQYINKLISEGITSYWTFGMRQFWKCPINEIGKHPKEIINALKDE